MVRDAPIGVTPSRLFINVRAVMAEIIPAVTSIKYLLRVKNFDTSAAAIREIIKPTPNMAE